MQSYFEKVHAKKRAEEEAKKQKSIVLTEEAFDEAFEAYKRDYTVVDETGEEVLERKLIREFLRDKNNYVGVNGNSL